MTEPDHILLQYMRKFDTKLDRISEDLRDVKFRLGNLESTVSRLEQSVTHLTHRIDRLEDRVTRVEDRLGLFDPQH